MSEISITEVHRKLIIEFQKEEITDPDTARDIGENVMVQDFSLNSKQDETPIANNLQNNWRPKTRPKNKLSMNMKAI